MRVPTGQLYDPELTRWVPLNDPHPLAAPSSPLARMLATYDRVRTVHPCMRQPLQRLAPACTSLEGGAAGKLHCLQRLSGV